MKNILFKRILITTFLTLIAIVMISLSIVSNLNVTNKTIYESNIVDYDYNTTFEEYTEISLDVTKVLPAPKNPEVDPRAKSIKDVEFYSGNDKVNVSNEIRIGMGCFDEKNFSYKVIYSDNTKSENKAINTSNLSKFVGDTFADRFIYDAGKYKVNIALNGVSDKIVLNLYMSEEEIDNPKRFTIDYLNSSDQTHIKFGPGADNETRVLMGTFGRKIPHLIPDAIPELPGDVVIGPFKYSFKEWDYNANTSGLRITHDLIIKGVYNVGHNSRCINLKDYDNPTINTYKIANTTSIDSDGYMKVYIPIGMMEGLKVWETGKVAHTKGNQETIEVRFSASHSGMTNEQIDQNLIKELYDYCDEGIEFSADDPRKSSFIPTQSNINLEVININPTIIVDNEGFEKYTVISPDDAIGINYKALKDSGYDNDVKINSDLASGDYRVALYYNFDVYLGFDFKVTDDTDLNNIQYDIKNIEYKFYQYGRYFSLISDNMTEEFKNDKSILISKNSLDYMIYNIEIEYLDLTKGVGD